MAVMPQELWVSAHFCEVVKEATLSNRWIVNGTDRILTYVPVPEGQTVEKWVEGAAASPHNCNLRPNHSYRRAASHQEGVIFERGGENMFASEPSVSKTMSLMVAQNDVLMTLDKVYWSRAGRWPITSFPLVQLDQ